MLRAPYFYIKISRSCRHFALAIWLGTFEPPPRAELKLSPRAMLRQEARNHRGVPQPTASMALRLRANCAFRPPTLSRPLTLSRPRPWWRLPQN